MLRKVPVKGRPTEWRFNPIWTRLHRDVHQEFGVQRLAFISRGVNVPVGQFLGPDEKRALRRQPRQRPGGREAGPRL